jgi:hypothetical protein
MTWLVCGAGQVLVCSGLSIMDRLSLAHEQPQLRMLALDGSVVAYVGNSNMCTLCSFVSRWIHVEQHSYAVKHLRYAAESEASVKLHTCLQ